MRNRYIDADELRNLIKTKQESNCDDCTDVDCLYCFDEWVKNQPTVEIGSEKETNLDDDKKYQRGYSDAVKTMTKSAKLLNKWSGWIPCTPDGEYPEPYQTVLLTAKMDEDKEWLVYTGCKWLGYWKLDGVENSDEYVVSAWMPLPSPYEGE